MEPRRSAVVVPVRLPAALERIRVGGDQMAALGVPAHITLLFPFLDPTSLPAEDLARLRAMVAAWPVFEFRLVAVRTFPATASSAGYVYLAPEPAAGFVRLTREIWDAWPDHPPYEGAFDELVPHLTLADGAARAAEIAAVAASHLPMRRRAGEAWLLVEGADDRWRRGTRLPLGVGP